MAPDQKWQVYELPLYTIFAHSLIIFYLHFIEQFSRKQQLCTNGLRAYTVETLNRKQLTKWRKRKT